MDVRSIGTPRSATPEPVLSTVPDTDVTTAPVATVVVPARNGEAGLVTALGAIRRAAVGVEQPVEVLVVTPENFSEMALPPWVRWLKTPGPGKFAALVTGAGAANSENLIFVDADVVPNADAFRHLLAPIISGEADICAGHLRVVQRRDVGLTGRLLERWAAISWETWHRLRMATPASCWALPGGLYALRRKFLPESALCAAVDDASIGLHAKDRGARFGYAPDALAWVIAPSSYPDWLHQKLRSRLGWAVLARHRPLEVAALQVAFRAHFAEVVAGEPTGLFLRAQDHVLRAVALVAIRRGFEPTPEWTMALSTKSWG